MSRSLVPSHAAAPPTEVIRQLFLDVDGVLADGGIVLGEVGELKRFSARDGMAAFLARRGGLRIHIITFRDSVAVKRRAGELGIDAEQGVRDKRAAVLRICGETDIPPAASAFMGDDLVDLEAMRAVGMAIAPGDAAPAILRIAHIVTDAPGGQGAVREALETLLWLGRVRELDAGAG